MLTTAEDYLDLVTKYKDIPLGKYVPDYSLAMFRDLMINRIKETIQPDVCLKMFEAINKQLEDTETLNITNVEVHFTIKAESMNQYITPYNKNYDIGNTHKFVHEKVVWVYRPEAIDVGYINEITYTDRNGKRETNNHKFGKAKNIWNIVVLHTHEKTDIKDKNVEFSTIHIAILYPVGDVFFKEICNLYRARKEIEKSVNENKKNILNTKKKKKIRIKKKYKK